MLNEPAFPELLTRSPHKLNGKLDNITRIFDPVFLPGESHGQRSLTDYSPWGLKESDMT